MSFLSWLFPEYHRKHYHFYLYLLKFHLKGLKYMHVGQKTTYSTSYTLLGQGVTINGATLSVVVDTAVATATVDTDGVTIDVTAMAVGTANITVTATLHDGVVLTATASLVVSALADILVLTQGAVV